MIGTDQPRGVWVKLDLETLDMGAFEVEIDPPDPPDPVGTVLSWLYDLADTVFS